MTLSNGLVTFTIDKSTAKIPFMRLGDGPNLAGRGGYFAIANSVGKDGGDINNGAFRVVRQSDELAEVSVKAKTGGCDFDLHYVLRRGDPGYYVFVKLARPKGYEPETFGQVRWSFYLDPKRFDYQLASDSQQAAVPDLTGAVQVQDATYRAKDGKVYTKYDFCDYVEDHYVHGMTNRNGGYGAFVVMGGNEYLGGPNKQYITVHSGPIIHRFLHSGHFLPRGIAHPALPDDWSKLDGPWFVYLNKSDSPTKAWALAKRRAETERAAWPYAWMTDPEYPVRRGKVVGTVLKPDGRTPAANALVVMTPPTPDWQVQILGYNFSARTTKAGDFSLVAVRPGLYDLHVFAPGGTQELSRERIAVGESTVQLGRLTMPKEPIRDVLWQIGDFDRRSSEFKLSDQPRQYGLESKVPANLTFTVGKSTAAKDWFYAQCHPGDWNVEFDVPAVKDLRLQVGIAGQTRDPDLQILVNGQPIGKIPTSGNSSAQYRSAILGSSYWELRSLSIPASAIKSGRNVMTLRLSRGAIHYDAIRLGY